MKLGDICQLVRGNTYKSSLLSETEGPVLLGLGSIEKDGGFKRGSWKHYPGESDKRMLLHPGDLYVSLKDLTQACSLLGAISRVPDDLVEGRLTQDTVKLELDSSISQEDKLYVYWSLRTPQYRKYCKARGTGTTNMSLSRTDFLNWEVPPVSPIRSSLISLFELIDAKIDANAKLNGYLEELLLAKCAEFENEAEESCTVGDYCKRIYSGGTPSTKTASYWNGPLPWLSSGETRARFIIDTEKTITPEGVEGSSTKLANRGSIVMASAGQGFTRGQTSMLLFDTYVNQSVVVMEPAENCGSYLLFALAARYEELRAWSDSMSTRGSMSGKVLKQFALPSLTKGQLERFESLAIPLIRAIESNLRESKSLAALRDALLPKLMSGEIDVSKVDLTQLNSHLTA